MEKVEVDIFYTLIPRAWMLLGDAGCPTILWDRNEIGPPSDAPGCCLHAEGPVGIGAFYSYARGSLSIYRGYRPYNNRRFEVIQWDRDINRLCDDTPPPAARGSPGAGTYLPRMVPDFARVTCMQSTWGKMLQIEIAAGADSPST
jgi:hypothetical protein